jgi:hypothetical protein
MQSEVPDQARLRFAEIVSQLEREARQRFGVDGVRLQLVGYEERPFSWLCRAAVRTRSESESAAERHVFIKIFKPKDPGAGIDLQARVMRDFTMTCEIHTFMSQWKGLGAVRPIACYEEALAIVTEQADGVTLLDALQRHAVWFPNRARVAELAGWHEAVGRWLKRFQGFHPGGPRQSVDALRDYVDTRLQRLVGHDVITRAEREQILQHLGALGRLTSAADLEEVAVHADLAPANILVSPHGVVVLDFAMAGRGTALHDISRLHMQLDLLRAKPQFRRAVMAPLQAALLRGFDPGLTPHHPLFRLLSMLHHVNHFGTLALRREALPGRIVSRRAIGMHRRWIAAQLGAGAS